jgi:hypothetical protein
MGTTQEDPVAVECPPDITHHTTGLARRAGSLRAQARGLGPFVAQAYRRRASELELEAWAIKARRCGVEPIAA